MLIQQGLEVYPEEVIITNGSEQAISLATSYYLQPDDWVIVETPTYHGTLGILENLQVKVVDRRRVECSPLSHYALVQTIR